MRLLEKQALSDYLAPRLGRGLQERESFGHLLSGTIRSFFSAVLLTFQSRPT